MNINNVIVPKIEEYLENFSGVAGIVIKDLSDGEVYQLRENEVFSIASIIKLTILWELFSRIEKNKITLSERRKISDTTKRLSDSTIIGGCGILKNMDDGLEPTIHDLATLMITISDNVATSMLIDELGMDKINEKAAKLGLKDTKMIHKTYGAIQKKGFNNTSSPNDVALLLEKYITSDLISKESREIMLDILKKQQLRNKLPKLLPIEFPLAHKTGDLPSIEHDAGIFEFKNRKIIAVVLTNELSDNDEGVALCNKIGKLIYDTYC